MAYGACIQRNMNTLEKGACEKEFAALRACFAKAVGRNLAVIITKASLTSGVICRQRARKGDSTNALLSQGRVRPSSFSVLWFGNVALPTISAASANTTKFYLYLSPFLRRRTGSLKIMSTILQSPSGALRYGT